VALFLNFSAIGFLSMLEPLKPLYNTTLRPLARLFMAMGLHPNHITFAGLIFFIGAGAAAAFGRWSLSLVLAIVGSLMDGLDGLLAREGGKQSRFGAIFDSTCDRLTEMALICGLMLFFLGSDSARTGVPLCFLALCGSVMVSYVKARCEGADIPCKGGLMQRPERLILLCAGLLAGPVAMVWILGILAFLSLVTMIQRLFEAFAAQSDN